MGLEIKHDADKKMFYSVVDGYECFISYKKSDENTYDLEHTIVPKAVGGRGIAGDLTKFVLDFAKSNNYKVIPYCSYISTYIKKHQEYSDIVKK